MTFEQFQNAGGVKIWSMGTTSFTKNSLWAITNVLPVDNKHIVDSIKHLIDFGMALLVALTMLELVRLWLNNDIRKQYRVLVAKVLVIGVLIQWGPYQHLCNFAPNFFDAVVQKSFPDEKGLQALFTFMDMAKRGMASTFVTQSADAVTLENASPSNVFQSITYTIFFIVWWAIPMLIMTIVQVLFVVGPIFIPFAVFSPLSSLCGSWVRLYVGLLFGYLLLALAFLLLLTNQVFSTTSVVASSQEFFSTIGFTIVGILIALGMPGFAVGLLGGHLNLMSWRR